MANIQALHSVGNSLVTYLQNTYPATLNGVTLPACAFALLSSGELDAAPPDGARLTLYLYRVTVNEYQRQQRPDRMSTQQQAPLGLDLHFLMTMWADQAQDELVPMAWAMRQLYEHPILDASYRLSVSYIARLVRLDPDRFADAGPVVATRLGFGTASPVGAGA